MLKQLLLSSWNNICFYSLRLTAALCPGMYNPVKHNNAYCSKMIPVVTPAGSLHPGGSMAGQSAA
ncbi:MAG: hypothetical protein ACTHLB_11735 [Parafilimonas sp.]